MSTAGSSGSAARGVKGKMRLEAENIPQEKVEVEAKKKEEYKKQLERQMEEKKERDKREKEQRKKEEFEFEEKVRKEREAKEKKLREEKERQDQLRQEAERLAAPAPTHQVMSYKHKLKGGGERPASTMAETREVKETKEPKETQAQEPKKETGGATLHEMIRTNQNWINTTLSKEYVMYKRREANEESHVHAGQAARMATPPDDALSKPYRNDKNQLKHELDAFKLQLLQQLEDAQQEAEDALKRKGKAEKKLREAQEEYARRVDGAKEYRAQLEAALQRTMPVQQEWRAADDRSVALAADTRFVGVPSVAESSVILNSIERILREVEEKQKSN